MTPAFNRCDPSTWGAVLTIKEIALIYTRSVPAIRKALQPSSGRVFTPRPYQRHPYRWRKVDVLRDVEGARVGATPARAHTHGSTATAANSGTSTTDRHQEVGQ